MTYFENRGVYGWKKVFYVLGIITGLPNPLFWLFQILANQFIDSGDGSGLFSKEFHGRTWKWGLVASILLILVWLL